MSLALAGPSACRVPARAFDLSGSIEFSAQYSLTRSSLATLASRPGIPSSLAMAESMAARLLNPPREIVLMASARRLSSLRFLTSMAPDAIALTFLDVTGPGLSLLGLAIHLVTSRLV